jgi:hypothetical protein
VIDSHTVDAEAEGSHVVAEMAEEEEGDNLGLEGVGNHDPYLHCYYSFQDKPLLAHLNLVRRERERENGKKVFFFFWVIHLR